MCEETTPMPLRIWRRRVKGWRQPPNTVIVSRPSRFGNPYVVGTHGDRATCVRLFEAHYADDAAYQQAVRQALRGKNLACWCPPDTPCHGEVLLRWANA